ncbi:aspartate racemase/maleate isomerase family protein [Nocardia aurantia]|uniref:Maleate isomerase n=1 Tax=Nocardia aurantia TaxID=2585199 RepID=A0A7K0E241_9NOCA|nr:aspartate/glutamate racemase family protein [Nocardia aurantia]MQY31951.1 Maleate isomerase [Nocardia aurantia]
MGTAFRLGVVTPSSNTALEPLVAELVAGHGSAHFTRIAVRHIGVGDASDRQFDTEAMVAAARLLSDARVDVVAWAGMSGSWLGVTREIGMSARLAAAAGAPATTSTLALLAACRAYGVRRLGLVSPYTADVSARIAAELGRHGIEVVGEQYCGLSTNFDFAAVDDRTVSSMIRAAAERAEAVAVVCTNMAAAVVSAAAEAELGIPVFDSIAATVWHAMTLAGGPASVDGYGDLLANGTLRARMQTVAEELLAETKADRTTLRLDLPAAGCSVATCAAESCGPAVRSIRRDATLPQRELATVRWLEENRTPLIQGDFTAEPRPPQALLEVYGVRAQMLGPVVRDGVMVAWLSVHSLVEREWTAGDRHAVTVAARQIEELLDSRSTSEVHRR